MTDKTELQALIQRLEERNTKRRESVALLSSTGALAVLVLAGTFLMQRPTPQAVTTTAPVPAPLSHDVWKSVEVGGKAAIVYDLVTNQVLYAKNAESQLPLASLTKLLTLYAASRTLSPNTPVAIGEITINDAGDSGFSEGETFTFKDIARLALVASSNIGAEAIANTARAAKNDSVSSLMASAASAAGLNQTYATNASGLDESTTQSGGYGSAKDIAILSGQLLSIAPDIARASTERTISITSTEGTVHTLSNTNPDVIKTPNILLSKTGFTDLAGGNLAVVFDAGMGHPVAVVVLGSTPTKRFDDVQTLISSTLDYFAGINPSAKEAPAGLTNTTL